MNRTTAWLWTASPLLACVFGVAAIALAAGAEPLAHRTDLTLEDRERIAAILAPPTSFLEAQSFETNSGGATTTRRTGPDAFSQPAANLAFAAEADFAVGNGVFRKLWVSAPSSTTSSDGLGPLFNARGCQECHIKDGRGHPPEPGAYDAISFLLALGAAGADGRTLPHPTLGEQLQDIAVPGLLAEGNVVISYQELPVGLAGGETASLRVPAYAIDSEADPDPPVLISPRIASQMIGLGLLEAIHPGDILAAADPDDADGDGVSGRVSIVFDMETHEDAIGRFGWKASQPSIAGQIAAAFANDMGLSTRLLPNPHGDCTATEVDCLAAPAGAADGDWEVADELFDLVTFYSRHLAVPARRDVSAPEVLAGKALFHGAGCAACHTPSYVTSNEPHVPEALRRQLIWPYTDLLLHDMGDGLADNRPLANAAPSEWRTAPLWGIGLTADVSGHTYFLHDGRARSLLEAILWHGGEAQAARDAVVAMTPAERQALLRFLESL
ncbi:MAG: c-type cytochrome [Bauldia sp.]|nr:c-type cytochrome [Bauldia sp.]